MQKSELKNLVFERFEERRLEIIRKRNRFQQELDQDVHQLREAYGDAAASDLGELSLTVTQPITAPTRDRRTPNEPRQKSARSRPKRKRKSRSQTQSTIVDILRELVPTAVHAFASTTKEFTTRELWQQLEHAAGFDSERIKSKHLSLFLGKNLKDLKLTVKKRKSATGPGEENVYRLKTRQRKGTRRSEPQKKRGSAPTFKDAILACLTKTARMPAAFSNDVAKMCGMTMDELRRRNIHQALSTLVSQQRVEYTPGVGYKLP